MKVIKLLSLSILLLATSAIAKAQTADEIVAKMIDAIGGADAWKKVNSIRMSGTLQAQGAEVSVIATVLNGKGARQDISFQGMDGYTLITPTEGWSFLPFQGQTAPEALSAEDLKQSQDQLDAQGAFIDFKAKGHTIEYLGKEDVEGKDSYKLKLTLKSGKEQTMFVDPATYYVIRTVTKQQINGQDMEQQTDMSNYEKLPEGVVVAKSIILPFGELVINKVEINGNVDESIFKKN